LEKKNAAKGPLIASSLL